jgi:GNAT superfamily N-acetyltransferase
MDNIKKFICRKAVKSDIASVAKLHLVAFDGFFLSQLGYRFLCIMYRAFMHRKNSLFVVAESGPKQLGGFAVGIMQGDHDRWLAIRFLPLFIATVIPSILRHPVLVTKRIWVRFFDTDELPSIPSGAAILRSIGVTPTVSGAGVASDLLLAFENMALSKGAASVYLTTDEIDNERAQRFYYRNGYSLVASYKQDGVRQMLLMSKILKNPK